MINGCVWLCVCLSALVGACRSCWFSKLIINPRSSWKYFRWQQMAMGLGASLRSMKRFSVRRKMRRTRWSPCRVWFGISFKNISFRLSSWSKGGQFWYQKNFFASIRCISGEILLKCIIHFRSCFPDKCSMTSMKTKRLSCWSTRNLVERIFLMRSNMNHYPWSGKGSVNCLFWHKDLMALREFRQNSLKIIFSNLEFREPFSVS